jgi:hypothetical protein
MLPQIPARKTLTRYEKNKDERFDQKSAIPSGHSEQEGKFQMAEDIREIRKKYLA